jgi:hypothetical protein
MVGRVTIGGLLAYYKMSEIMKNVEWRTAIEAVGRECSSSGKVGIFTADFMTWEWDLDREQPGFQYFTDVHKETFTHILYMAPPAETIA